MIVKIWEFTIITCSVSILVNDFTVWFGVSQTPMWPAKFSTQTQYEGLFWKTQTSPRGKVFMTWYEMIWFIEKKK